MSAGEVERLVSELSGGTGGDEEEEWLYGGTELPVLSLSPGFSQAYPPGAQTVVHPGSSRPRLGPLGRNLVRPKSGPARCARSPACLGLLLPSPHPQTCPHPATPGLGRGAWPPPPSAQPGLLGPFASAPLILVFHIDSEQCWCVSSSPLIVGCPSCPFL